MPLTMDRPFSLDDDALADKKRLESFKLGGDAPQFNTVPRKRLSHGRSHSRNGSVSLSFSMPAPAPVPAPAPTATEPRHHAKNSSVSTSRSSHHRRRSSVSTRRESAEMMGVALPDLPPVNLELNINLGDKDSVRRRALWTLEGKSGADKFSPVEIPELTTPDIERRIFELPNKPSYPSGPSFTGLSGLAGKRDSFGNHLAPSASTKDQLHTLVEEEEEEEEVTEQFPTTPAVEAPQDASFTGTPTGKPRPAGLNLRPLSLTPGTVPFNPDFPSPAYSPSPRCPPGLKTLTLASSPSTMPINKRQSFIQSSPDAPLPSRRSSLSYRTDSMSSCSSDDMPRKRSSISYKPQLTMSNLFGLPTPEATPTSERRCLVDSNADLPFLNDRHGNEQSFRNDRRGNEQFFLAQSHAVLLTRITDLERALKSRSRPQSLQSDASNEPSDEFLQLVADLKAERDELTKDCSGWRTRVADLEKQTGVLAKRVDVERREAWVARERVGLMEVEKRAIVKQAEEYKDAIDSLQVKVDALSKELAASQTACAALQADVRRGEEALEEVSRLRKMLSEETHRRQQLERELEGAGLLGTPVATQTFATRVVQPRRWQSFGSESSTTDVESVDGFAMKGLGLNAVVEENEDEEEMFSDEDNGLASYEDEGDNDYDDALTESSTSSSIAELPRDTSHLVSQAPAPSHSRSASLVREWAFPTKGAAAPGPPRDEEVDRFFGCLEDLENSPPLDYAPASRVGNPFCSPPADDNELPPFVIPSDVGVEVFDPSASVLEQITEEDEEEEEGDSYDPTDDEFVGEVDEGGIKFTFDIPPEFAHPESPVPSLSSSLSSTIVSSPSPPVKLVPLAEDDDATFTFPVSMKAAKIPETPVKVSTSPRSSLSSPSSIPRATSLKKFGSSFSSQPSSPSPTKIPSVRPSFIPQPTRIAKPSLVPQPRRPSTQQQPTQILSPVSTRPHGDAPSPRLPSKDTSSPTFRSPVVSIALQSFASFIPQMPWSSAARGAGCGLAESSSASSVVEARSPSSASSSGFMSLFGGGGSGSGVKEEKRGFVSKERQLERLRVRMEEERRRTYVLQDVCKRCGKDEILL
ncbi:hypothetical protein K488DRAFT_88642 [Vararia minispora EC-137]|uniref:Uncharacterized protein n=1 Tax=Vararia minispora EC-137 TaxID=1314806 RepID=A0ACB8QD10_9AGAM|nr:hypothetical protein K488DRAFT_88642 [Vararia minispora EC-137]